MAYEGPFPIPVPSGGTGVSTLTGIAVGTGTSALTSTTTTQYNVLCAGTSNAIANVAPSSTVGYALTCNGASSNPSFQAVTGNDWVFLGTQSASNSSTVSLTSLISATYTSYFLMFYNVYPVTDNTDLQMVWSTNNGSSYLNSGYFSGINSAPYNSTTYTNENSTSLALLAQGISSTTTNMSCCGSITLLNVGTGLITVATGQSGFFASGGTVKTCNICAANTNTGITAIQFAMSSGNISTGTFSLYGLLE